MTNTEKKVLVYLFLKSTEPRREPYRLALSAMEEIQDSVSVDEELTKQAVKKLLNEGYIGFAHLESKYYLGTKGTQKAKDLIWSLVEDPGWGW